MHKKFLILTTGFALFSMFFGSGNLVFPIALGQSHTDHTLIATLGLLLTGVVVPFLGVYTMCLFHGEASAFFGGCGSKAPFWFSLICLGLLGPFGVVARCISVAHGSLHLLYPQIPLEATSLTLCGIIYFAVIQPQSIVKLLGNLLTPILLLCLLALTYFGLNTSVGQALPIATQPLSINSSVHSFMDGFLQGYQTMDLLAAFFFSTFIFQSIMKGKRDEESSWIETRELIAKASVIGATLLALVYCIMVALGSTYSEQLAPLAPQDMLGKIAFLTLGLWGGPVVCCTVLLACLTTAIVLTALFANFLHKELSQEKLSNRSSLVITLTIAFAVSTLDFVGIAKFLGPILEWIYPSMIALTLINLTHKKLNAPLIQWPIALLLLARFFV